MIKENWNFSRVLLVSRHISSLTLFSFDNIFHNIQFDIDSCTIFTWLDAFPAAIFKGRLWNLSRNIFRSWIIQFGFQLNKNLVLSLSQFHHFTFSLPDRTYFLCRWFVVFDFMMINVTAYISISGCFPCLPSSFSKLWCCNVWNKLKIKRLAGRDQLNGEKICSDNFKWSSYLFVN